MLQKMSSDRKVMCMIRLFVSVMSLKLACAMVLHGILIVLPLVYGNLTMV